MPDLLLRARRWVVDCFAGSWTVTAIYVAMNAVVALNAVLHDPRVGYDAGHHLAYVQTIAEEGRLPAGADTKEFHHPPLPYVLPAAALWVSEHFFSGERRWLATGLAAKVGQLANLAASLVMGLTLLRCCAIARPGNSAFAATALGLVAMVPAYYRTFAFLRGDPYLVCFAVLTLYGFAQIVAGEARPRGFLRIALALAAALCSRIFALLLVPPILVAAALRAMAADPRARRIAGDLALGAALGVAIGGPILFQRAASGGASPVSLIGTSAQTAPGLESESGAAVESGTLFTAPLRPSLGRNVLPIFYADTWGDYWRYFTARDEQIGAYLGRVNALALLPSAVFVAGVCIGAVRFATFARRPGRDAGTTVDAFCFLVVVSTALGFAWVLASLPAPAPGGPVQMWEVEDNIKPTYVLQALPFLALLAAEVLEWLRSRSRLGHRGLCIALALVALHNLAACVTRFPLRFGPGPY